MGRTDNPKEVVRRGYDLVSTAYRADTDTLESAGYKEFLDDLLPRLQPQSRILDLGCGCGVPVARALADDYAVTGLDLSEVQIERARKLVPDADFIRADMTAYDFAPGSFAAIVSFYALIHIPRDEQPGLLAKMTAWLEPAGWLLATVGHRAWTGREENWCDVEGAAMYWSLADRDTYRRWLADLGYRIVKDIFVPEDDSGHIMMLAQKG